MRALPLAVVLVALVAATPALAAPVPGATPAKAARPVAHTPRAKAPVAAARRPPLTLAAQNIQGRAEGARVLFVHTGPTIALEDAPKHPSYLRDDFTAALSSPVTVHVRNLAPLRASTSAGGTR